MPDKNVHEGHRKRMRESFLKRDFSSLQEHEILEMLLFYAIPRNDTNALAHTLISAFGSLEKVLSAPYEELVKIKGVGDNAAVLIVLFSKLSVRYVNSLGTETENKSSKNIINELIAEYLHETKEIPKAVLFDKRGRHLNTVTLTNGGIESATFKTRELMEAMFRCDATAVIFVHNHPQGFAVPSATDIETTKRMKKLLDQVDIELRDHIIIAGQDWFSMKGSKKYADIF